MKMWAVGTPHSRWTTWICLPTSCGCCQGDLGEDGLDLHFFWHAGDHHWNPILFPLFFSCLALIKNFGPSISKHTTKFMNPILFSWLARNHRHWEVFYKCNQCNYEYTFVENLRIHKQIFTNASNVTTNVFSVGCLMNHIFFLTNSTNDNVTTNKLINHKRDSCAVFAVMHALFLVIWGNT